MIFVFSVLSIGSNAALANLLMKNMTVSQYQRITDVHKVVGCLATDRTAHCQLELMKQKKTTSVSQAK